MSTSRRLLASLVALSLGAAPAIAHAEEGELALSVGPALWLGSTDLAEGAVTSVAPLGFAALRYGLDDYWQIGGSIAAGAALSGDHDPGFVGLAHAEAYYFVDIITWVLWAVVGVGVLARDVHPDLAADPERAGPAFDLSVTFGLGLDYRPARAWSVGASFRYQVVATDFDRTSPTGVIALTWTSYFE